jgi:hypothetical protein
MKTPHCLLALLPIVCCASASAIEVRVTAPALERTLQHQVFNQPDADGRLDRHYLKGNASKGCSVYADEPHVSFKDDRVVVSVKTHAKLGIGKSCFGISITSESQVSFIPEAEGERVGFRDAHIERLTGNKQLDALLEPFLAKKLPQEMKVNAADLLRKLLVKAPDSTGYTLTLEMLQINAMEVDRQDLVVDLDARLRVD